MEETVRDPKIGIAGWYINVVEIYQKLQKIAEDKNISLPQQILIFKWNRKNLT